MTKKSISVLIIDQDTHFTSEFITLLKEIEINNIQTASSGTEGVLKADRYIPDIIFLHNELADKTGISLIPNFKKVAPKAKIILLSSQFELSNVASAIQQGVDYLLDKEKIEREIIQKLINSIDTPISESNSIWSIFKKMKSDLLTSSKPLSIAIIEDNELFSFYLTWQLNQKGKFKVSTFPNASDFRIHLETESPDIVLLDYYLPDSNGKILLEYIKNKSPKSKVIIISSQESPEIAMQLKTMGVDNYLVKDSNFKEKFNMLVKTLA
jgi:DNA-binding NarL/FixJ family response regulator